MSDLNSATWHELDSANTDAPPDGWPEGQPANSVNNCARAGMGALKRFYDRINATLTSGGSANAQTLTYTVAPTALVKGDTYSYIAGFTNSGAVTLNVGVGGAVPIRVGASALSAGSITVGDAITVMYDGTNFQFTGWEPARTAGQNLSVNTLTVTGSGTSVTLSAGSLSVAGNAAVAGTGSFGSNLTGGTLLSAGNLYLGASFIFMAGNTNAAVGPLYYADTTNSLVRIGAGNGQFLIQNNATTNVHFFNSNGNAAHNGSLSVGTSASIGTSLSVGTTLSVLGATGINGSLTVGTTITAGGNLAVNGGNLIISGVTVLSGNPLNTGYTVINDNAQRASIYLGSGDAQNYYRQTQHTFQSQAGGATWLTLSSGSFHATQNAAFDGSLTCSQGISSNGSNATLLFQDRTGGFNWAWFGTSSVARLWESVHGDRVTVDTGGSIVAVGNITASANLVTSGAVYCNAVGVIYQNIGANGFNFRWDGAHILGRVDNVVEYPLYSSNGGTVSGSITATGNLQVNGAINCNVSVNTVDYYCSGVHSMTAAGGFVQIFDLATGLASILCGGSVIGIHYPFVMNNNIGVTGHESGGTVRNMMVINGSNQLVIGDAALAANVTINSGGDCTVTATGNFVVSNNDAYKPGGGSWQAISDVRVKEDVKGYEVGLEALKLRPVTYKLNGKGGTVADGREYVGLIADEVEPIMPEMVGRLDDDELGEIKTIDPSALTYAILNTCKVLAAKNADLEDRIRTLEKMVT